MGETGSSTEPMQQIETSQSGSYKLENALYVWKDLD